MEVEVSDEEDTQKAPIKTDDSPAAAVSPEHNNGDGCELLVENSAAEMVVFEESAVKEEAGGAENGHEEGEAMETNDVIVEENMVEGINVKEEEEEAVEGPVKMQVTEEVVEAQVKVEVKEESHTEAGGETETKDNEETAKEVSFFLLVVILFGVRETNI